MALSKRRGRGGEHPQRDRDHDAAPSVIPLPKTFETWATHNRHAGLALDKLAKTLGSDYEPPRKLSEKIQHPTVRHVADLAGGFSPELYAKLLARQRRLLTALRAVCFDAHTVGPVTLHLARASSLENAGIALHRIYGFPYLPGTQRAGALLRRNGVVPGAISNR